MAARKHAAHDEKTREKIRKSQLVNVLIQDAKGEIELTAGRRKSIEILLRKSLPDLSSVTIEGGGAEGEIVHTVTLKGVSSGS